MIAFLLAFASLTMGLASCEKDSNDTDPTPASIEGLWIGSYAVDGYPGAGLRYFSFIIKPDGTVINDTKAENQQHLSIGNWTLTGDLFECTVRGEPDGGGGGGEYPLECRRRGGVEAGRGKLI